MSLEIPLDKPIFAARDSEISAIPHTRHFASTFEILQY